MGWVGCLSTPASGIQLELRLPWKKHGVHHVQKMQHANGEPKGAKPILKERSLWRDGMRLECQPCIENVPYNQRRERYNLPLDDPLTEIECYCLSQEPDFAVQCEWLVETVENREHSIIFYLMKYHCELNFIERIWNHQFFCLN